MPVHNPAWGISSRQAAQGYQGPAGTTGVQVQHRWGRPQQCWGASGQLLVELIHVRVHGRLGPGSRRHGRPGVQRLGGSTARPALEALHVAAAAAAAARPAGPPAGARRAQRGASTAAARLVGRLAARILDASVGLCGAATQCAVKKCLAQVPGTS
jgi:hypothetical protein